MSFTSIPIDELPYKRWANMTPSDSTVYDPPTDAIWVQSNNTGDANLVGTDDTAAGFHLGGGISPLSVKKFMATGSTITNLIGLWRD